MTDILIIIAICVGVICLIATIAVGLKVKNSSAGAAEKKLEEITRLLVRAEALQGETARSFQSQEARINDLKKKIDDDLKYISETTARSVENIRAMVEEKLASTIEGKLNASYRTVSEQLEKVYKGIGEVNTLAANVTDIKKLFSNVKLRGTWGEVQLSALLEQMLSPAQYRANVKVDPLDSSVVEYAVVLPSRSGETVLLPIDSKFPVEEYRRLTEASDSLDKEGADRALKNLERALKLQADTIAKKYIRPPLTADFAIMFLPLEGLYAESIRMPGLAEYLAAKHIMACGPSTLGALLTTLQIGYKTAAIERRSGELWELLAAFKHEFRNFVLILEKTQKKLQEAQDTIENAAKKTRTIERKLKNVSEIPGERADLLLSDEEEPPFGEN